MHRTFIRFMGGIAIVTAIAASIAGCETTTAGGAVGADRKQLLLVSSEQMNTDAVQAYRETTQAASTKGLLNRDQRYVGRVRAIANRLIPATGVFRTDAPNWNWEVNVISSDEVNAWCMAGGKIAVYTGLIEKLNITDDELAAVMGHEIAHALREHGREKASQQQAQSVGVNVLTGLLGLGQLGATATNLAVQVAVGLPYSRGMESEADRIGVELAARAGYDPRAAITLWQKMGQISGGNGPGFLSTHPTAADRITVLQKYAQQVMPLYEATQKR